MENRVNKLIKEYPRFSFLKSAWFNGLSDIKKEFVLGVIDDAIFWADLESEPNSDDGFKFLAAAYGLGNAHRKADEKGLEGKERELFIRPHQDLYTMFNPYSGNNSENK